MAKENSFSAKIFFMSIVLKNYCTYSNMDCCWKVRGAPAIAMVGCLSLAVELLNEELHDKKVLRQEIEGKLNYLVSARPTAVNMKIAAEELISLANQLSKNEAITPQLMKDQ